MFLQKCLFLLFIVFVLFYPAGYQHSFVHNFLIPYLLVYKSTPHFSVKKSGFSSYLVKEVKFRQIEIPQKLISYFWERIENTGIKKLQSTM